MNHASPADNVNVMVTMGNAFLEWAHPSPKACCRRTLVVAPYVAELRRVLSADRLERYRPSGGDDLAMIATYLWNTELFDSLYHSLGAIEMVRCNSLHAVLTAHHRRTDWYDVAGFLMWRQPEQVAKAKQDILAAGKAPVPGRVVAALSFGFWTTLLSRGYGSFWNGGNRPLVKQAFPFAPVGTQYHGRVLDRFNAIRLLRNRVFPFESIWDDPDLLHKQAAIIDAIDWVSPMLRASVIHFDRVSEVHRNGRARVEAGIRRHLGVT